MESPLCPPSDPGFRLIETLRWEPGHGHLRRTRHVARLLRSAARLGISPQDVDQALDSVLGMRPLRIRLTVDRAGRTEITRAPYIPLPGAARWHIALSSETLSANDPWLRVKTTRRQLYDTTRAHLPDGIDEVIFANNEGHLCEGTITNLFADLGQGLLTPSLTCGLLPGILREEMLENGDATEAVLTSDALQNARAIYVGNSLRGLIPAKLVAR